MSRRSYTLLYLSVVFVCQLLQMGSGANGQVGLHAQSHVVQALSHALGNVITHHHRMVAATAVGALMVVRRVREHNVHVSYYSLWVHVLVTMLCFRTALVSCCNWSISYFCQCI